MTTPTTPTTLVARSPQDVLAVVPVVLGFVPQDSVVMLTFDATTAFHARIDLPPPQDVPEAVSLLLDPALRHRVRRVVFVLYTDDAGLAAHVSGALWAAFGGAGVDVVETLRADGRCWFPLRPGRGGPPQRGVPYDVSAHPFAAQAVVDGRVTHGSRDELAATLAPAPERVAAVSAVVVDRPRGPGQPAAQVAWVRSTVARHAGDGTVPDDVEAARLLAALRETRLRDAAWCLMGRDTAQGHVALWTDLVRRSPADLLPAPAALLGFAAWLAGHGALAWCAVDVCQRAEPDYGLAGIVSELLAHAVPPSEWDHDDSLDDVFGDPA